MKLLPRDRVQQLLFVLFLVFFAGSCIRPPYLQFLLMQHVPTILAILLLGYVSSRFEISRFSFALVIVFLCLHTLGARYLYSYVPYDDWTDFLLGVRVGETLGFERNHYDRLVHFSYGLLLAIPVRELELRTLQISTFVASLLAIEFIIATSTLYELLEWLIAIVFTPDWAESFLGQQGDVFDAQKDTGLAFLGALIAVSLLMLCGRDRRSRHP